MQSRRPISRRVTAAARRLTAGVALLGLAACGANQPESSVMAPVSGFAGFAAADEPQAASVGERILSRNGTAADAAVAMALSMSVTLPSRAGLGGGGVCLVSTPDSRESEVYDFLPQSLPEGGVVPATARGLALLHARHGGLMWPLLVTPAEQQARFGFNMSRALERDLQAAGGLSEALTRDLFGRASLDGVEVGDSLTQAQLSTLLAGMRQRGAGYLYTGDVARRFAVASEDLDQPVPAAALRDYRPLESTAREAEAGNLRLFMPTTRASEAVSAALSGAGASASSVPSGAGSAGLVAGDRRGNLVACALTMGEPFGGGRMVPGAGLVMADASAAEGADLAPTILRNRFTGRNVGAVSAVGGQSLPVLTQLAVDIDAGREDLRQRVNAARGPAVGTEPSRINLLACPAGLAESPESCTLVSDPAGFGLGVRAQ